MTVIATTEDVALNPRASIAWAVSWYAPATTLLHVNWYGPFVSWPNFDAPAKNSTLDRFVPLAAAFATSRMFVPAGNLAPFVGLARLPTGALFVPTRRTRKTFAPRSMADV